MSKKISDIEDAVCYAVNIVFGVNLCTEDIFHGKKEVNVHRYISMARQFIHYLLHEKLSMAASDISKYTGMSCRNVFNNIRKVKFFLHRDELYIKMNNIIKKTLM